MRGEIRFLSCIMFCEVKRLTYRKSPSIVRLGDQNLASSNDGAEPVDYSINRFISHERYDAKTKENDIALIELKSSVTFTEFIRPACLRQSDISPKIVIAVRCLFKTSIMKVKEIFVCSQTGWGQNGTFEEQTDELQKVRFRVTSNDFCEEEYHDEGDIDIKIKPSQMCAGFQGKVRQVEDLERINRNRILSSGYLQRRQVRTVFGHLKSLIF
jgi:hypothetical protein